MCLDLRFFSRFRFNRSDIRYKIVEISEDNGNEYCPPFRHFESGYSKTGINQAILNGRPTEQGFHVFVDMEEAKSMAEDWLMFGSRGSVKTVRVNGFLRSGTFYRRKVETYKEMEFLD